MNPPTGRSLAAITAAVCIAILLSAAGYIAVHRLLLPKPEVITPIVFQPLTGVLAERGKYVISEETGISLTTPVSITYSQIALHREATGSPEGSGETGESAEPASISGAYAMRLQNAELCKGNVCPVALVAQSADKQKMLDHVILMGNMASIAVSSQSTNGNPDLIIDANGDGKTTRLWWDEDNDMPHYTAFPKPRQ